METPLLSYEGVALVAPVTVPYVRYSDHSAHWFLGRALAEMVKQSGIERTDIDGLAVASFTLAPDTAVSLTDYFSLSPRWLEYMPTGGAGGVIAARRAARAIQAGDAEIVACIGGDTNQPQTFKGLIENFSSYFTDAVYPYGAAGPNMVFAMITRHYMEQYAAGREDFGRLCVAQRDNALLNPYALLRTPLTLDAYLNARPIAEPLHLYDCVMPCAGAEGFLVMSTERARSLKLPYAQILGAGEKHNAWAGDAIQFRGGWRDYRDQLYQQASCAPADIDFLQTYDDYPVIAFMQMQDLGFCAEGEAAQFIRDRDLRWNGDFPHNTSGGQLSSGQAGAGGGFIGIVEAIRQLTDDTIPNKVADARLGMVSGYGMVNYDRCLCTSAAILARADQ